MMPNPEAGTATGWFPAFTLFVGLLAGWISDWFKDNRAAKREREAREATRRAALFERRANVQRETLLSLQDAVAKLARTTGRMHHLDLMNQRSTGKWGGFLFPENLDDDAHQANVAIMLLTSRVRDEDIREAAEIFRNAAAQVPICQNAEVARDATNKMLKALEPLHKRIGELLRKLDDDEDARQITTT